MDRVRNVMLSRRGWVVVLTVLAVAGVVFRWHWLVALGLASIVLSVVPCLIMCALGLCAYRVLTQRLILQTRFETNAAIQRVEKFTTGSGLNDLEFGVRLRYEIRREFAPYVGISLDRSFGETATLVRQDGGNPSQIRFAVGVRAWF